MIINEVQKAENGAKKLREIFITDLELKCGKSVLDILQEVAPDTVYELSKKMCIPMAEQMAQDIMKFLDSIIFTEEV
jgi:hypothetical protein